MSSSLGGGVAVRRLFAGSKAPGLGVLLVERTHQIEPGREQPRRQRLSSAGVFHLRVGAEEFEVLAVVEDAEKLLVLAGSEQIFAEASAAPHHLPELGLGTNLFKEDEVHDLRHVDAGI